MVNIERKKKEKYPENLILSYFFRITLYIANEEVRELMILLLGLHSYKVIGDKDQSGVDVISSLITLILPAERP